MKRRNAIALNMVTHAVVANHCAADIGDAGVAAAVTHVSVRHKRLHNSAHRPTLGPARQPSRLPASPRSANDAGCPASRLGAPRVEALSKARQGRKQP